jgi:hypothetical protein
MPACATVCIAALARLFYEKQPTMETSGDCISCSVGNPGVYIKDGSMVCPHRPALNTKTEQQITACKYCGFSHGPCDKCII